MSLARVTLRQLENLSRQRALNSSSAERRRERAKHVCVPRVSPYHRSFASLCVTRSERVPSTGVSLRGTLMRGASAVCKMTRLREQQEPPLAGLRREILIVIDTLRCEMSSRVCIKCAVVTNNARYFIRIVHPLYIQLYTNSLRYHVMRAADARDLIRDLTRPKLT